jgi:hypothetical protein
MPLFGTTGTSSLKSFGFGGGAGPVGQVQYTTAGTYTWIAPIGVTLVSVVAVGGGAAGIYGGPTYNGRFGNGGGGGGLGWKNNITVVPGNSYTVVVGVAGTPTTFGSTQAGDSYFISLTTVKGGAAVLPTEGAAVNAAGGSYVGDGGGNGGSGGAEVSDFASSAGGGAGGYTGNGGNGANSSGAAGVPGSGGGGGGGGSGAYTGVANSGFGSAGGGVGLIGQGVNGAGGANANDSTSIGRGGSGGTDGTFGRNASGNAPAQGTGLGGNYGGGGSAGRGTGAGGAVRIMWGGGRSYPNNAADV